MIWKMHGDTFRSPSENLGQTRNFS